MRDRNLGRRLLPAAALLIAILTAPRVADAAATITVVNLDGPLEGFNDISGADAASTAGGNPGATLGEQRLIAFERAAEIWGRFLDSSVTIRVGANFDPDFCTATSAVLGSAGPQGFSRNFTGAPRADTWYPFALASALFGSDVSPGNNDIGANFNSSIGTTCPFPNVWYYGLDADPPAGTIDFLTVVLHELGHGLGFLTIVDLATGTKANGFDDTYMLNLEDHNTGLLYPNMTDGERITASISGELHWVGPEVFAAGVGLAAGRHVPSGHVEIYAPNPQEPGSSVSHFSTSLGPDELMEPFYTDVDHGPGLAKDLMADLGWTTGAGDAAADIAGDRTSDIPWRNTSTGNTLAWLMNGFDKSVGSIGAAPTFWQVEALGDFDGIGKSDVLWYNTNTGSTLIWQMSAFNRLATASVGAAPLQWRIAGAGDFDADGTADILWRNTVTGGSVIWRMLGLAKDTMAAIGAAALTWEIAGVGDFDGDGTDDILWRNTSTGGTLIWRMLNLAKNTTAAIGALPLAWEIVGVGDFDGDGTDDILWHNTGSGTARIWRMVALGKAAEAPIGTVSSAWQVVCVGDYDGGGKADILWRNSSTGSTLIWQMDGFVTQATGSTGAASSVWQVRC